MAGYEGAHEVLFTSDHAGLSVKKTLVVLPDGTTVGIPSIQIYNGEGGAKFSMTVNQARQMAAAILNAADWSDDMNAHLERVDDEEVEYGSD